MRRLVLSVLAVAAVFAAPAGTLVPDDPSPAVSASECAIDTRTCPSDVAAAESSLDTILFAWDLSPWPGIFLNTKPFQGFLFVIR